jgi:hypothetical protein
VPPLRAAIWRYQHAVYVAMKTPPCPWALVYFDCPDCNRAHLAIDAASIAYDMAVAASFAQGGAAASPGARPPAPPSGGRP